jgi:hypothetical protein
MKLMDRLLIALVPLALHSTPAAAVQFDFETTAPGLYADGLSVTNSGLTLTVTPEASNAWIEIRDTGMPLLARSAIGTGTNPPSVGGYVPMRFAFSSPIGSITFAFGDGGGDDDSPWTIAAYDSLDTLLVSNTGSYPMFFGSGLTSSLVIDLTTGEPVEPSHSVQPPVACSIDHRERSPARVEDLGEALIEDHESLTSRASGRCARP